MSSPECQCSCPDYPDSPLSTTANVAGILTFAYAIVAGLLAYMYLIKSFSESSDSVARFYDAFAACALETDLVRRDILASSSANLVLGENFDSFGADTNIQHSNGHGTEKGIAQALIAASAIPLPASMTSSRSNTIPTLASRTSAGPFVAPRAFPPPSAPESLHATTSSVPDLNPYILDPDSLARLYSHVRSAEIELQRSAAKAVAQDAIRKDLGTWDRLMGKGRWVNRSSELQAGLEKREALTPRLLVVQMSLMGNRTRTLGDKVRETEIKLETQAAEIQRLRLDSEIEEA